MLPLCPARVLELTPNDLGNRPEITSKLGLKCSPLAPGKCLNSPPITYLFLTFPFISLAFHPFPSHFLRFPPFFLALPLIIYFFLFFHFLKYFQMFFRIKKYFSMEDENGAKLFFSYTPIDLVSVTAESLPEAPMGGFR